MQRTFRRHFCNFLLEFLDVVLGLLLFKLLFASNE